MNSDQTLIACSSASVRDCSDKSANDLNNDCDAVNKLALNFFPENGKNVGKENKDPNKKCGTEDDEESRYSGEVAYMDMLLKRNERKQVQLLRKLEEKRTSRAIKKTTRGRTISSRDEFETIEENWEAYLDGVPKKFFRSKEATLEDLNSENFGNVSSGKAKRAYQGLIVTPKNNADMLRIYESF